MNIILKLVGSNEEANININKDEASIVDIFNYLMENNLSYDEVSKLMFIHNGKNISDDIDYIINDTNIIHIFINEIDVKNELCKHIFNNEVKEELDFEKLSIDETIKHNEEIIKLFSDDDFTYLLKICLTKPELINKVSGYLSNGNITNEIKNTTEIDFKYNDVYLQLIGILEKINVKKDESEIKSVIQHFNGCLNLSLRCLLTIKRF
jgi:hypothetical protein